MALYPPLLIDGGDVTVPAPDPSSLAPDEKVLTGAYYDIKYGTIGVFGENVDAFYDGDSSLMYYSYTAKDGSYCSFNEYFELEDVYTP